MWKENLQFYVKSCLSSCLSSRLSYQLFITFLLVCPRPKTLTHQVFVSFHYCLVEKKKKNTAMISPPDRHSRELSSRKQPPSPRVRESDRVAVYWWQLCNYVIKSEKRNFVTSQDAWWVRIPITTHYNSIHMIISSRQAKSLCVRMANIWIKTALAMMILWRALLWLSKKTWGPKRWLGHFRIHFHLSYHIPSNGDVSL